MSRQSVIVFFRPHIVCIMAALVFATAMTFAPLLALASPNLLTNGSFESGSTGWTSLSGGATLEISNSPGTYGIPAAPAGSYFCEVEDNNLSPTSTADYIQQSVSTTSGKVYIVSIKATTRANLNTADRMIIQAAGTNLSSVTTNNSWVTYQTAFTAGAASSVIRYISNGSATGSTQPGDSVGLMVDDAQVQALTVSQANQVINEDGTFTLSGATALQVATNSTSSMSVTLSVADGKLTLASTIGLTFAAGANASASFTITGTAAAINAALTAGLTYNPIADYNGNDAISFNATTGTATETDTIGITINPVADIVADNVTTTENAAITYNAITGTNGASADNFENTPTAVSVSVPTHGTAVAAASPLGQITYTPTAGYFGTDSFTYTVTSGGVTETATETITINPLNPSVTLSKISNGGVSTFTFTGNNGWTSQNITTVTAGTAASGATQFLTTTGIVTTINETITPAYLINSATCTDTNSANTGKSGSFGTLTGGALAIPSGNVVMGAAIACTFTNTKANPQLSIIKTPSTWGPVNVGNVITYTYKVKNIGNVSQTNVAVIDVHNGTGTLSNIANETLIVNVSGLSTDTVTNDGIWSNLGPGDTVAFTATYTVTQHDIDYL
ncbi:MAG TPA: Ig-like domain-containing protein [Aestuariivirga sp.]